MNKKLKKITVSIAAAGLAVALLFAYYVHAVFNFTAYGSSITVDEEHNLLEAGGDSCKILQLSDIQTSNLVESAIAYPMVERVIKRTEPDLIVLTGDNISNGSSRTVLNRFITFMDSFEIPWGLVFGNHDYNSDVSPAELCDAYEKSEYCIFKQGNIEDRYGNYYYNIALDGEIFYSLFFMDNAKGGFTAEQVAWYADSVTEIDDNAGRAVPSLAFYHIPIEETLAAHDSYAADPTVGSGRVVDDVRAHSDSSGFFDTVCVLGSTKALFFGHDHENNTFINYRGVLFCYATKTGRTVYYANDSLGGNLIVLKRDGSFTVERVSGK